MTEALADLLRRVEEARGPDRDLDAEIEVIFDDPQRGRKLYPDKFGDVRVDEDGPWFASDEYTKSIDAAIALAERVLPGCSIRMGTDEGPCWACVNGLEEQYGEAPTLPLAIISAILKAKAGSQ